MSTAIGRRRHLVTLQNPTVVVDGEGGFTTTWADLSPSQMWARIEPATASRLERVAAGTVQSAATHIATMLRHTGVTTKTRLTWVDRGETHTAHVTGVGPTERGDETVCLCAEVIA